MRFPWYNAIDGLLRWMTPHDVQFSYNALEREAMGLWIGGHLEREAPGPMSLLYHERHHGLYHKPFVHHILVISPAIYQLESTYLSLIVLIDRLCHLLQQTFAIRQDDLVFP